MGLFLIVKSFPGWIPFYPYPLTLFRLIYIIMAFVAYGMSVWMDSKRWYVYVLLLPVTIFIIPSLLDPRSPLWKAEFSSEFLIWLVKYKLQPIIFTFLGGGFYYYRKISD